MDIQEKRSLHTFRRLTEQIKSFEIIVQNETEEVKSARIKRIKKDYKTFVEYYFPHMAKKDTVAKFQIDCANILLEKKASRLNNQWSRGFAKSITFGVFVPIFLMAHHKLKFMVLCGANLDKASRLLDDLKMELLSNQRLINDYGVFFEKKGASKGDFVTRNGVSFKAIGRGQSPRGLRYKSYRPDYILCDDVTDDEIVQSKVRMDNLYSWTIESLLGATSMGKGRFVVVENKYHNNCLSSFFEKNEAFITTKVNALDENGKSNWEEVHSTEDVLEHKKTVGTIAFMREYMNQPISTGNVFNPEWLETIDVSIIQMKKIVCYIDPSFTNNANSDYKAIVTVGFSGGCYYILDLFVRKCSVKNMVAYAYEHYERMENNGDKCSFFIETSFYQSSFLDEFKRYGTDKGYQLPIRGDNQKKANKFARIESMSALFERRLVFLNKDIDSWQDTSVLKEQLYGFGYGSKMHDDGIDALESAISMLNKSNRGSTTNTKFGSSRRGFSY